jgi:adenosine deaminase
MSTSFVTSAKPYKEILTLFNTEISKGFDIELFEECFKRLRQVMRGKGYVDRAYNDYNLRELNISWRMQTLAD